MTTLAGTAVAVPPASTREAEAPGENEVLYAISRGWVTVDHEQATGVA